MIGREYGLRYDTSQREGALHSSLKPPLDEVVSFPELATGFERVGETVRCRVQGELQRYCIEHGMMEEDGSFREVMREESEKGKKAMKSPAKTSVKSSQKSVSTTPVKSTVKSTVKSPVKVPQTELHVDEAVEKHMTPMKRTSFFHAQQGAKTRKKVTGVVFRYQKGFTCAVRQAAMVDDFLWCVCYMIVELAVLH